MIAFGRALRSVGAGIFLGGFVSLVVYTGRVIFESELSPAWKGVSFSFWAAALGLALYHLGQSLMLAYGVRLLKEVTQTAAKLQELRKQILLLTTRPDKN